MEKVSKRKQIVLDSLDEQIEEIEDKLKPAQKLMDELQVLRRTRATLLDERRPTGGGGRSGTVVQMETIILDLKTNGPSTAVEVAERTGTPVTAVRSHLNRYRDQRYDQIDGNQWRLIGETSEEEEEDDE